MYCLHNVYIVCTAAELYYFRFSERKFSRDGNDPKFNVYIVCTAAELYYVRFSEREFSRDGNDPKSGLVSLNHT